MPQQIHIKISTQEAVDFRRKILSTQINLLNLIKKIRSYRELREKELVKKLRVKNKVRALKNSMGKLKKHLPKVKIPEIEKKDLETEVMSRTKATQLEYELEDIRDQLAQLG